MLRTTKILLVLAVALWGFVGGFQNFSDWAGTTGSVASVASMGTFDAGSESWKATDNPAVIWMGALFIALSKLTAAVLCMLGALRMCQQRGSDPDAFAAAKAYALSCSRLRFSLWRHDYSDCALRRYERRLKA